MLDVSLRLANKNDIKTYFHWANDKEVRQNAINQSEILWETHQKWFINKLDDKNAYLYIFEYNQKPVGQVRFDFEDNKVFIDFSVDKNFRGKGLGSLIVKKTIQELQLNNENVRFVAIVKRENIASMKVFQKLAFTLVNDNEGLLTFEL